MNNVINGSSFLRTSRNFPADLNQLAIESDRAYIDIARNVNNRTIGFFTVNRQTVGGENWVIEQNKRQQNLRQVYNWNDDGGTLTTITIAHGINFFTLSNFVRIWGTFFDGTNWQTLPYVDVISATNQINVKVNSTDIIIIKGAGAPPLCSNGLVILEWISVP
jgi:hypothetical protein